MVRKILGIIGGFVAWSILWIGSDQVCRALSPDWYGAHMLALEKAMFNKEPFMADSGVLLIGIFRSVVISVISGFTAALIAGENSKTPAGLGVLLLLFGIMVQAVAWSYMPLWYHLVFLLLLVPMTIIGGKMKSAA
jgi:hypothetical protein